jgi:hypothetical protein
MLGTGSGGSDRRTHNDSQEQVVVVRLPPPASIITYSKVQTARAASPTDPWLAKITLAPSWLV